MDAHGILNYYYQSSAVEKFCSSDDKRFLITGEVGAVVSVIVAAKFDAVKNTVLVVLPDEDEALRFQSDLRNLLPEQTILFFPSSLKKDYNGYSSDNTNKVLRTETLNQLVKTRATIIVATAEGFAEKVVAQRNLERNTFVISENQVLDIEQLFQFLEENDFERTDFVYEPGEFAVRGGIIDIFPFNTELPFRISMDDDHVAGLRIFELDTQFQKRKLTASLLFPTSKMKLIRFRRFWHIFHQAAVSS